MWTAGSFGLIYLRRSLSPSRRHLNSNKIPGSIFTSSSETLLCPFAPFNWYKVCIFDKEKDEICLFPSLISPSFPHHEQAVHHGVWGPACCGQHGSSKMRFYQHPSTGQLSCQSQPHIILILSSLQLCCHSWWLCSLLKPFCSRSVLGEPSSICSLFPACHTINTQERNFTSLPTRTPSKLKQKWFSTCTRGTRQCRPSQAVGSGWSCRRLGEHLPAGWGATRRRQFSRRKTNQNQQQVERTWNQQCNIELLTVRSPTPTMAT